MTSTKKTVIRREYESYNKIDWLYTLGINIFWFFMVLIFSLFIYAGYQMIGEFPNDNQKSFLLLGFIFIGMSFLRWIGLPEIKYYRYSREENIR